MCKFRIAFNLLSIKSFVNLFGFIFRKSQDRDLGLISPSERKEDHGIGLNISELQLILDGIDVNTVTPNRAFQVTRAGLCLLITGTQIIIGCTVSSPGSYRFLHTNMYIITLHVLTKTTEII